MVSQCYRNGVTMLSQWCRRQPTIFINGSSIISFHPSTEYEIRTSPGHLFQNIIARMVSCPWRFWRVEEYKLSPDNYKSTICKRNPSASVSPTLPFSFLHQPRLWTWCQCIGLRYSLLSISSPFERTGKKLLMSNSWLNRACNQGTVTLCADLPVSSRQENTSIWYRI